jgi:hypothetical protein
VARDLRLFGIMIRSPALSRALSSVLCRECRGSGRIVLFRTVAECGQCGGAGRVFPIPVMGRNVDEFDLSWRARAVLQRLSVRTIADLARLAGDDVRRGQFADPIVVTEVDRLLAGLGVLNRN